MRHPGGHLPEIRQPLFTTHLLFELPDLGEIFENADQARLFSLFVQGRYRHPEHKPIAVCTLAFHFKSFHGRERTGYGVIRWLAGMPIEEFAPGTAEDLA